MRACSGNRPTRNAWVSYFTGTSTAQAQLDILKASTSKLISNDAIDLSLLITDNFNMDTITAPMEMFARADLLRYRNRLDDALLTLDSLVLAYPGHTLEDEVLLIRGDIAKQRGAFNAAIGHYEEVLEFFAMDILADDALFQLARLYDTQLGDTARQRTLRASVTSIPQPVCGGSPKAVPSAPG